MAGIEQRSNIFDQISLTNAAAIISILAAIFYYNGVVWLTTVFEDDVILGLFEYDIYYLIARGGIIAALELSIIFVVWSITFQFLRIPVIGGAYAAYRQRAQSMKAQYGGVFHIRLTQVIMVIYLLSFPLSVGIYERFKSLKSVNSIFCELCSTISSKENRIVGVILFSDTNRMAVMKKSGVIEIVVWDDVSTVDTARRNFFFSYMAFPF